MSGRKRWAKTGRKGAIGEAEAVGGSEAGAVDVGEARAIEVGRAETVEGGEVREKRRIETFGTQTKKTGSGTEGSRLGRRVRRGERGS